MTRFARNPGADLAQLVELQRQQARCAVAGDAGALVAITQGMNTLCDRIESNPVGLGQVDAALLRESRRLAEQGQRDVQALISGLNTALGQLHIANAPAVHGVYGPEGERVRIEAPQSLLEKRR